MPSSGRGRAIGIVVLILVVLGAALWSWRADQARKEAELQLGLDSSRIVAQAFASTNQLKVSQLTGKVTARAEDPGMVAVLASSQTMTAPFSVDYFVDLSQVAPADFAWDAKGKKLVIAVPDPLPARPNIDEGAARITQTGLFISRTAALRLARQASVAMAVRAAKEAQTPANMQKAREAARAALRTNALAPLKAAGVDVADVQVRFRSEGRTNDDVWDYTTRIEDVPARLDEMRRKRWP
jgi:hypothetical protein